ncbi:UNVERIFIED_CONTAM: hypothetical protein Sradi_1319400 [Sesamum radiatum]|uniref:Uncharacterized protein n=1 Tax=Sesamum radiatum TaxID=300843 RepID=A0AAW2UPV0_SESRA
MTWHATLQIEEGSMCHPSDAEAWKYFDRIYPEFAEDQRNVRLHLCTDGFSPHVQYGRTYSCWLIIINRTIFLPNVRPTTDHAFMMRAALMWTVNDLPIYGMAFGWSTTGIMGCPVCMDNIGHSISSTVGRRAILLPQTVSPCPPFIPKE